MNKNTLEQLEKLWERVPEFSLGHLVALSVKNDTLYQMSDDELLKKVKSFVVTMENQKNIRRG